MKKKKHSKRSQQKQILILSIGVLFLALLVALVILIVKLASPKDPADNIPAANLSEPNGLAAPEIGDMATPAPSDAPAEPNAQPNGGAAVTNAPAVSAPPTAPAAPAVNVTLPKPDFAALQASGVSAVGWLYCAGTVIDYPLVQHTENEYYMDHASNGQKSDSGAIFLDCRNSSALLDEQIMIYGNPMADGSMFGSLLSYKDQAYYAAHPSMHLITGNRTYRIDVFAAHAASPDISNYPTWFLDKTARKQYIDAAIGKSSIKTSVSMGENDVLVSLVTCSDYEAGDNARFVVHGVLVKQ